MDDGTLLSNFHCNYIPTFRFQCAFAVDLSHEPNFRSPEPNIAPRYFLNTTEVSNTPIIDLAPLGPYVNVSYNDFIDTKVIGQLVNIDASNPGDIFRGGQIAYLSCDSVPSGEITPFDLLSGIINGDDARYVILYSSSSNHCQGVNLTQLTIIQGIFTTVGDPSAVNELAGLGSNFAGPGTATILPDLESYKVHSSGSSVPSNTNTQHSQGSGSHIGAIVGATVGGIAGLIIFLLVLYIYIRRRKKKIAKVSPSAAEDKPELYAGPVDPDIAGPVKPKHELRSQGTVQRKPLPHEKLPEKYSTTIEELGEHEKRRIVYPEEVQELGDSIEADFGPMAGTLASSLVKTRSEQATTDTAKSTRGPLSSAAIQPSQDSYSAAEADFVVQELGLISMRKRILAEQAAAAGRAAEEMGGRAGEQYSELLERELKLRKLLDEMQSGV